MFSENAFKHEDNRIRVMCIRYDISLEVVDVDVEKLEDGISHLRIAILQMLCLENLCKEEAAKKVNENIALRYM